MPATATLKQELRGDPWSVGDDPAAFRAVRRFHVELSAADVNGRYLALSATGIPPVGEALFTGSTAKCKTKSAEYMDPETALDLTVTCEYAVPQTNGGVVDPAVAPWDRDPLIDFDGVIQETERMYDFSPTPVKFANTAGVPYRNGFRLPVGAARWTVKFARQVSAFNPFDAQNLIASVNQSAMTFSDGTHSATVAAKHLMLLRASCPMSVWVNPSTLTETYYYPITLEIAELKGRYDETGAAIGSRIKVPSMGLECKPLISGKYQPCVVKYNGRLIPAATPQYLDVNGEQTQTPYYQTFEGAEVKDWSPIST